MNSSSLEETQLRLQFQCSAQHRLIKSITLFDRHHTTTHTPNHAFPLKSALSLLSIFSQLASIVQAGNSRFYIVEQGCQGGDYVEFDIKESEKCHRLGSGTAGSLYSPLTNDVNIVSAFNRAHSSDCGNIECTINHCTLVDDIGEPFVEPSDGTHFGLGIGKLGKFTVNELQVSLEAKGQDQLSDEKIAELVEIQFIKSE
ncbi:hypothetical protein ACHAQJ_002175 [Trichoderma viride]